MRTDSLIHRSRLIAVIAAGLALAGLGCRQDMHDQPKLEPLEWSAFFPDGRGSRQAPAHTIARGTLPNSSPLFTGVEDNGEFVSALPVQLSAELLDRGEERFNIYCTPCHDRAGGGRGMIVERGFRQPPSYHEDRLLEMPVGYLFDVITNGYGQMSGYSAQIKPADRWAITAWIRVLQKSQNVDRTELTGDELRLVADGAVVVAEDETHANDSHAAEEAH